MSESPKKSPLKVWVTPRITGIASIKDAQAPPRPASNERNHAISG